MALTTFKKTASKQYLKMYDIDYWIKVNENAKKSTSVALNIPVTHKQLVPSSALESAFAKEIGGKYIYVPDEFKSLADFAINYQTLMILRDDSKVGEYLYFDSHSKNSKQGTDIYRVLRISADDYSLPEPLSAVINSPYDEAYPFYDNSTAMLYFSSKGHNTSGGYDIFCSRFDSVTNEWTVPDKLEFPINTPYDDFLYAVTKNNLGAIFLSNRNMNNKEVIAYTLAIKSPVDFKSMEGRNEIIAFADMKPEENDVLLVSKEEHQIQSEENFKPPVEKNKKVEQVAGSEEQEYERLLKEALDLQAKSDSLNWTVKNLSKKINAENNYKKKQELIANIVTLDKEAKRMQRIADEKFLKVEQIRGIDKNISDQTTKVSTHGSLQKVNTTANTSDEKSETGKEIANIDTSTDYKLGYEAAVLSGAEINTGFRILNSSPYSNDNPIPLRTEVPEGLIYRIQLGAFTGRVPENSFGGLIPITSENLKDRNITKYYLGYFTSISEARKALESTKKYGYPDAFLVSYFNKEKISVEKAREIEFAEK
jgi:hypothetical protein